MSITLYFISVGVIAVVAYAVGWWRGHDSDWADGYRIGNDYGLGHRYISVKQRCDLFEAECKKLSRRVRNQRLALRRRMAQLTPSPSTERSGRES